MLTGRLRPFLETVGQNHVLDGIGDGNGFCGSDAQQGFGARDLSRSDPELL